MRFPIIGLTLSILAGAPVCAMSAADLPVVGRSPDRPTASDQTGRPSVGRVGGSGDPPTTGGSGDPPTTGGDPPTTGGNLPTTGGDLPTTGGDLPTTGSAAEIEDTYTNEERRHWSLQPRMRPTVPAFDSENARQWVHNPVDAFVLRKLQQAGLQPAAKANRRTLIRRLAMDLTGLPPSPQDVHNFIRDRRPDAWGRLVDRFLASPQYGERWGQHWLDVVRFSETEGFEYDRHRPDVWRYRDFVIRSLNADKPYDRFVTEQLAGDEMAEKTADHKTSTDERIAAAFHRLGPVRRNAGNAEVAFSRNEVLTEMTDIVGTAFLGLSLGCARCHDHKYDPIRQIDYYRLQAFMAATHEYDIPLADKQTQQQWEAKSKQVNEEIKQIKEKLAKAEAAQEEELRAQLKAIEARLPQPLPVIFSVRNDAEQRTPIHLLERGDEEKKRQRLGMRVLGVLVSKKTPELPSDSRNPKSRLAEWLTADENPLFARVMVNRVWQYHFGRGIVSTANDFGANGEAPSHPRLLDYLANEFVSRGWRLKPLHRLILTSSTYQQASRSADESSAARKDAGNRLLWRFNRRRLDAEEIRDCMLSVSGRINLKAYGKSIMLPVDEELIKLLYKPTQWQVTGDPAEHDRRSVYLIAKRNLRLPFMDVFDQPDLQTSCSSRQRSTHAPQALELLNGRLSNESAEAFAQRLLREAGTNADAQIERAFLLATGRPPTSNEQRLARDYLQNAPLREFALAMFNLNAFLYVD